MNDVSLPAGRTGRMLLAVAAVSAVAAAIVQNRSRKAEREHPPTGRFVRVDGVRLHYVDRGDGEPLVLLHGNTTMGMDFMLGDFVDMLASRYRVIVFDRPGYGWSERPRGRTVYGPRTQARLIHRALERMGVRRPIVHGHSWGTLVAMAMALDFPEAVRAIVLESGYYYPTVRAEVPIGSQPAVPVIGDFLRHTFSPLILRANWPAMVKLMFAPSRVPDYFWDFPPWMAFRPSQARASAAEIAQIVPSAALLSRRYHELRVPGVVITGEKDRMVWPTSHSERLTRELPHLEYRVVPGSGHMLHHIAPGEVVAAIDTAARATSSSRAMAVA